MTAAVPPVALVTGAAGGLGAATCRALRAAGFDIVATDRSADLLADVADRPGYTVLPLDVTSSESARAVAAHLDRLDVLVNNAGIIGYFPVVETDPDIVARHFEVNTLGALRTTHAFLDLLIASHGRVINVTSEAYRFRNPFQIYGTTKLALEGLSDVLRRELAPLDVQVATVRPGAIDTDLFHAMADLTNPIPDSRLERPFARFARGLAKRPPAHVSSPDEVAALIARAAAATRMRPHYAINNMLTLRIAGALPTRAADAVVGRILGRT